MIIFIIIGSLVGAGFASGQEIYLFFYKYGKLGILGLIISCLIITYIIYKTLLIILENDINNYKQFLDKIINNKKISQIINFIVNIFLIMTFYIMVSGFGAYFEQELGINYLIGTTIISVLCYSIFLKNISGVKDTSSIIVPILIIFILIIGIINFKEIDFEKFKKDKYLIENMGWIIQSLIYSSYNMILLIPVLSNLKKYLKNKKQIKYIAIFSGIIIFILALNIFLLLSRVDINFNLLEMPAVYVIGKYYKNLKIYYGIIILLSIFTTALSTGISFLENIVKNKRYFPQIGGIMCITSLIISNFGFSNLLKILFPVFGYLGLIQIINIRRY